MSLRHRIAALLPLVLWWAIQASAASSEPPAILLDPGHTPTQQGALGVRGKYEVGYNDRFTAKLAKALSAASIPVNLTRQPDQSISLDNRAALANDGRSGLFLSIHHDSAQLAYLKKLALEQGAGYQTTKPIAGFSIFVSKRNPAFEASYRFAELLGRELLKLGRPPSLHHAEHIAGENRELLNDKLGVYRFDDLVVLAKTTIPAVLLEVGVIVDEQDEQYVSDETNQDAICQAIVNAIRAYSSEQ